MIDFTSKITNCTINTNHLFANIIVKFGVTVAAQPMKTVFVENTHPTGFSCYEICQMTSEHKALFDMHLSDWLKKKSMPFIVYLATKDCSTLSQYYRQHQFHTIHSFNGNPGYYFPYAPRVSSIKRRAVHKNLVLVQKIKDEVRLVISDKEPPTIYYFNTKEEARSFYKKLTK